MTFGPCLKRFQRRCRIEGALEAFLAVTIVFVFSDSVVSLRAQGDPDSSSIHSDASQSGTESPGVRPADLKDYQVSPDDLLEVSVFDVPELSRQYRVSPNGSIR